MALKDLLLIGAATPLLATVGFYSALFLQRSGLIDATLLPFFAGVGIRTPRPCAPPNRPRSSRALTGGNTRSRAHALAARKNVLMATLAVQYLFVIASGFIANSVGAYGGYFNNNVTAIGGQDAGWAWNGSSGRAGYLRAGRGSGELWEDRSGELWEDRTRIGRATGQGPHFVCARSAVCRGALPLSPPFRSPSFRT